MNNKDKIFIERMKRRLLMKGHCFKCNSIIVSVDEIDFRKMLQMLKEKIKQ